MSRTAAVLEQVARAGAASVRAGRGRAWLLEHGFPDHHDEAWRSTPVEAVLDALEAAEPATTASPLVDGHTVDALAGRHGGPRLVYVDGLLVPGLSALGSGPSGVWLGGVDALRPMRRPGDSAPADQPGDAFHALNWVAGHDVAAVMIDPAVAVEPPIHVVHITAAVDAAVSCHPRTVVRVGANSRAQVIETFAALGTGRAVVNASTRIVVDEGARVTYHRLVDGDPEDVHVGRTGIEQATGSAVRAASIVLGGGIVRSATHLRFDGDGARADLVGLCCPTGDERHDQLVAVDHAADRCVSAQRYKGIADDHGRGSFGGHVIVRPGTVGTDASQSNPNLLLARTAQLDTRPWLEIFADDVRCTHGATVGRLDEDALFYLRSRGVPAEEARAMLVDGFAAEITDAIAPESLRSQVVDAVRRRSARRPT